MSCYHPMVGLYTGRRTGNGKKEFRIACNIDPPTALRMYPGSVVIPCGHCIGCRLDYSRAWADRMMLELESNDNKGVFLTLTYECRNVVDRLGDNVCECNRLDLKNTKECPFHDECLEECRLHGSLYKRHVQLFMKSLRKEFDKTGTKLRMYAVGEYGSLENSHRPHYHIILFGISLDDLPDKIPIGFNELRQEVYTTDIIARYWPHGFISVGDVSWKSCAYVSRYVTKKALDPNNDLVIEMLDKNPMFSLMSRKPGLGANYLNSHPDCLDYISIPVYGDKKVSIPKYFLSKLELTDADKYRKMMDERREFASDRMMLELSNTDLSYLEYLENKEQEKVKAIKSLKRYV